MTVAPKQENIEVLFAVLSSAFDQKPASVCKSVPDFFKFLQRRAGRLDVDPDWTKDEYDAAKLRQPAIAPVGGRRKDSPLQMGYVPFDFDKLNDTDYARLSRAFRRAPFLNIQHTTASHKHACKGFTNAFRVIVPLNRTIDANDSWRVQRVLLEWAGLELAADLRDKCTEDANRLVFLPHADAEFIESRSQRLADVTELLSDAVAMGLEKRAVKAMTAANDTAGSAIDDAAFENGWDALSSGRGYEVPCPNAHLHAGAGSTSVLLDGKEPRFICMHTNNGACTILNTMQHVALSVSGVDADKAGIARRGVSRDEIALALPDMPEGEREALRLASMPVEAAATDDDLMDDDEPLSAALPVNSPVIENMMNAGEHGLIFGAPNCGKTMFIANVAYSVATGTPFLGKTKQHHEDTTALRCKRGPVVYVSGEGTGQVKRDILANEKLHGAAVGDNFIYVEGSEWEGIAGDKAMQARFRREYHGAVLVVFDTFASVFDCEDENSASKVKPIMAFMQNTARLMGCAVVATHHTVKNGSNYRGSGAIEGSIAFAILLDVVDPKKPWNINMAIEKKRSNGLRKGFAYGITSVAKVVVEADAQSVHHRELDAYFGEQADSDAGCEGSCPDMQFSSPFDGYALNHGWSEAFEASTLQDAAEDKKAESEGRVLSVLTQTPKSKNQIHKETGLAPKTVKGAVERLCDDGRAEERDGGYVRADGGDGGVPDTAQTRTEREVLSRLESLPDVPRGYTVAELGGNAPMLRQMVANRRLTYGKSGGYHLRNQFRIPTGLNDFSFTFEPDD